jgi:hypothetical protein
MYVGEDNQQIVYDNAAIEALLDRNREDIVTDRPDTSQLLANDYLSSFKVASYVMKDTSQEDKEPVVLKVQYMQCGWVCVTCACIFSFTITSLLIALYLCMYTVYRLCCIVLQYSIC